MTILTRNLFGRLFKAPRNVMEAESRADQMARECAFLEQKAQFAKTWVASGRAQATRPALDANAAAASLSCILPGLFLSGKDVEAHADVLKQHGITHVLQVRGKIERENRDCGRRLGLDSYSSSQPLPATKSSAPLPS
jgi:hypothetical protein